MPEYRGGVDTNRAPPGAGAIFSRTRHASEIQLKKNSRVLIQFVPGRGVLIPSLLILETEMWPHSPPSEVFIFHEISLSGRACARATTPS